MTQLISRNQRAVSRQLTNQKPRIFPIMIYIYIFTVEHIYDACPKYSELGNFRIIANLYVSDGSRR